MAKIRADQLLVERGLVESREKARILIMAGRARVGTTVLIKPAQMLAPEADIALIEPDRYVSRGGLKLEAALVAFAIDVAGLRCLDVGASTGGFTDCLLQRGAASVVAVDVGRGQLHVRLRNDPRVTVLEGVNARALPDVGAVELFVADVSFISLRKVLPAVAGRTAAATPGVVLLKPQFEAGPQDVPRGGVIRDADVRARVLSDFEGWLESEGWERLGVLESPVRGGDGNIEFLVWLRTPGEGDSPAC